MIPLSETRERFLNAIAQRVPSGAIEEAHFFKAIKQGGMESGVAVIAVRESRPTGAEGAGEYVSDSRRESAENRRLAVYNAQYRLTLKGPERGKWEFFIKAEADAPLVTVDAVVRGVQRRTGDEEEPLRLTGDEVRSALPVAVEAKAP